jgi:putative ABC transport system permease protein
LFQEQRYELVEGLIRLDILDLVLALGMMAIAIGLSAWERLGLEWSLAIATGRTVLQLLVVGYILEFVFALDNPWAVLAVLAVMLTIAAVVARNRISKKYPALLPLVWGSILVSTALTLGYTNLLVIQPASWYEPQYLIPLAGIVLGNAMNGAAIAGERLVSTINVSQLEIETHLSLGATPQQAMAQYRKDAIKAGLIPTLNQMMVVGVVTLPGIITGQLLSGANPLDASSYQILIMFMLAFANLVTTLLVTQGLCRQFFNQAAQLIR